MSITIDSTGVARIANAGQMIGVSKSVTGVGASAAIVWVTMTVQQTNILSWSDGCGLFVTTVPLQPAQTLTINSRTPGDAEPDCAYSFTAGQFEITPATGAGYGVLNDTVDPKGGMFSFGLLQDAAKNDELVRSPTNALPMLYNQNVWFVPHQTIYIYLVYQCPDGTVSSGIPDNALPVSLNDGQTSASVGYNDATNSFYLT